MITPTTEQTTEPKPLIYYEGAPHIYACNPTAYSAILKRGAWINVKQARLFCTKCSRPHDVTKENSTTLPDGLIVSGYDLTVFNASPVYGGQCLSPDCELTYKGNHIFRKLQT